MEQKPMLNLGLGIANTSKNLNKEILDFSFVDSDKLKDIEDGITKAYISHQKINLALCVAFYNIQKKGLYFNKGYESFSEYLKAENTQIPYSVATEYYYIGRNYMEMRDDLVQIGFTEQSGLSKLKVFPKKYDPAKKQELLEHLKNDTTRQFKIYVANLNKKIGAQQKKKAKGDTYTISEIEDLAFNEIQNHKLFQEEIEKILKIQHDPIKQKEEIELYVSMALHQFKQRIVQISKDHIVKMK